MANKFDILEICRKGGRKPVLAGNNEYLIQCPKPEKHKNGDNNPSCAVNADKAAWYCRVCGAKGGYKALAAALGVEIGGNDDGTAPDTTHKVYERARKRFDDSLTVRRFLEKRGLTVEAARAIGLGFINLDKDWMGIPAGEWVVFPYGDPGSADFYIKLRGIR